MTWVKLDDQFAKHPKAAKVGPVGQALFTAGLCYCAQYLTDGFIPSGVAATLIDLNDPDVAPGLHPSLVIERLVSADMWEPTEGGYIVHDYLDYQPSRDVVQANRSGARDRMSRRRSPEVRANTSRSSASPVPVPQRTSVPVPGTRDAGAHAREAQEDDDGADPHLDALCQGLYGKPASALMPSERDAASDAIDSDLGEAEPAEIQLRAAAFRQHWPQLTPSPRGVVRNWTRLGELIAQERPSDASHQHDSAYAAEKRRLLAENGLGPDTDGVSGRRRRDADRPDSLPGLPQPARGP